MKVESLACGATWLLMNALLVMVVAEQLSLSDHAAGAPTAHYETGA